MFTAAVNIPVSVNMTTGEPPRGMISDISDLGYVRIRLARAYARRSILAAHAIQYRLAEVGPYKFDLRALEVALRKLSSTSGRLDGDYLGLYADPSLESAQLEGKFTRAIDALTQLVDCDHATSWDEAADAIARALRSAGSSIDAITAEPTRIVADKSLPRRSSLIRSRGRGTPILCWLTHELPWIYPDDPRLWEFLERSMEISARPLLVARKIAPVTFPFLKALGAHALQYHLPLPPADMPADLPNRLEQIGWPPMRTKPNLRRNPMMSYVRSFCAQADLTPRPAAATEAILEGVARGFGRASNISHDALLAWAETARNVLPHRWVNTLHTWAGSDRLLSDDQHAPNPNFDITSEMPLSTEDHHLPVRHETIVTHGLVAAEVDRETWDKLVAKIEKRRMHK